MWGWRVFRNVQAPGLATSAKSPRNPKSKSVILLQSNHYQRRIAAVDAMK